MARKTKAIAKAPKQEKNSSQNDQNDEVEVFSQSFKDRLDQYSTLSKEILTIKADLEGNSPNKEINQSREKVSKRIEETSAEILKEELKSLEQWIANQQKNISEQVERINQAHGRNREALKATGAFTQAEIEKQLEAIEQRAAERQAIYNSYGQLLARSKNIYDA